MTMPSGELPEQTLWTGRFLRVIRRGHWEFVQRINVTGVVGIVALTPDRRLIVVEQHRIPLNAAAIELPAGLAGDIPGQETEAFEFAARRELLEETGYGGGRWQRLFEGPSSAGMTDESLTLFLAEDVEKLGEGGGNETETILVHAVPLPEVESFLRSHESRGSRVDFKVRLGLYYLLAGSGK